MVYRSLMVHRCLMVHWSLMMFRCYRMVGNRSLVVYRCHWMVGNRSLMVFFLRLAWCWCLLWLLFGGFGRLWFLDKHLEVTHIVEVNWQLVINRFAVNGLVMRLGAMMLLSSSHVHWLMSSLYVMLLSLVMRVLDVGDWGVLLLLVSYVSVLDMMRFGHFMMDNWNSLFTFLLQIDVMMRNGAMVDRLVGLEDHFRLVVHDNRGDLVVGSKSVHWLVVNRCFYMCHLMVWSCLVVYNLSMDSLVMRGFMMYFFSVY